MTGRTSIFWQTFFAYGLLNILALGILGFLGAAHMEQMKLQAIEDRLRTKAAILDDLARSQTLEDLQSVLRSLHEDFGSRITLIAADGSVLADTGRQDPAALDNHAQRPELVNARTQAFGTATRYSATTSQQMMYVARRVGQADSEVAFVRVSRPVAEIEREVGNLRLLIGLTIIAIAGAVCFLTWVLARRMAVPLQELDRGASALERGFYGQKVYLEGTDELGRLAHTFNAMSGRLAEQVAEVEHDRRMLRALLSGIIEGAIAIDAEAKVIFANERAAEWFGFETPRALGRKLWEVLRIRAVHDMARRALASGDSEVETLDVLAFANRSLSVHAVPLAGAGSGAVLLFHDVTDLTRLRNTRQELLTGVSHELRTPLSVISACVDTLQSGAVDDLEYRDKFLESIAAQSQRLTALIGDLLVLSRIESNADQLQFKEVDIEHAVNDCIERHRSRAHAKHQRLEAVPPAPSMSVAAWADEGGVSQALDLLIGNAIKFTPEHGAIQIHWGKEESICFIEVRDNGVGIPANELQRIFERFYRVDKARSREQGGGAGLGLAIVERLVRKMGGSVSATSEFGAGSVLRITLKRTEAIR